MMLSDRYLLKRACTEHTEREFLTSRSRVRRMTKGQAFIETVLNDSMKGDNEARRVLFSMARLTGQLEVAPENKLRTGGVLVIAPPESMEEWERKTAEQQRKYREAPSPDVKKPGSDEPTKN